MKTDKPEDKNHFENFIYDFRIIIDYESFYGDKFNFNTKYYNPPEES